MNLGANCDILSVDGVCEQTARPFDWVGRWE